MKAQACIPVRRLVRATLNPFALAITLLAAPAVRAEVTVENVSAAQQPGTKLVEIAYDVASTETNVVTVSLEVRDGDTVLPASSVGGDIGPDVATGVGKTITWDAGADWPGNVATLNYTVTADDGGVEPGMPAGGDPTATSWEDVNERWVKNTYADGAITMSDRTTGLMWVYDASANGQADWDNAIARCNNLTYAGHSDWFLPDLSQLSAMYSQKAVFSNVQDVGGWLQRGYWSSTSDYYYAWVVNMRSGGVFDYDKYDSGWVWPCRSGQ